MITRLKFKGADPPLLNSSASGLPPATADAAQPSESSGADTLSAADQEKLKEEESTITYFVEDVHTQIEQASKDL